VAAGVEGRRHRAGHGHAARAHARRHDPEVPQILNTVVLGSVFSKREHGILSPGKQGIWPKHLRNGR
jgi:hypothetical protein